MSEFLKKTGNNVVKDAWFWFFSIVSIGFLAAGLVFPPPGEISNSVLIGVAEIFCWGVLATVVKAINQGNSVSLKKGDVEVNVKHEKKEDID